MVLSSSIEESFGPFPTSIVEASSQMGLLATFFRDLKFKNTSGLKVIFYIKMFDIESKFGKFDKKLKKSFLFLR